MIDKENLAPEVVPQNLFFSQSPGRKNSVNKGRYTKNIPQEFAKIENSIMEETETESFSVKRNTRKVSELIRPEGKGVKTVHVRKVSDDDIVVYREDEVLRPAGFWNRVRSGLGVLCRCVKK